jgi:hypothetical protein
LNKKPAPTPKKIKKQLPSDDEDSDEENEKQGNNRIPFILTMY